MAAPETPQQEYERLYGKGSAQPQESAAEEYQRLYGNQAAKQESPEEEYRRTYEQPQQKQSFLSVFEGPAEQAERESMAAPQQNVRSQLTAAKAIATGEIIPRAYEWFFGGDKEKTGADVSRELDIERRTGGMIPEYRKMTGGILTNPTQFAANAAGDVVGMVGAIPALGLEIGTTVARELPNIGMGAATDVASYAYRKGFKDPAIAMFGNVTAGALAAQQEKGESKLAKALEDSVSARGEFIKGMAFGMSPAVYEGVRAAGGVVKEAAESEQPLTQAAMLGTAAKALEQGYEAGKEAFYAFPVASILPFYHAGKRGLEVGGKPVVREGQPLQTVTGKELVLNRPGEAVMEPITRLAETKTIKEMPGVVGDTVRQVVEWGQRTLEPEWQKLAFDVVPSRDIRRQQGLSESTKAMIASKSESAQKLKTAIVEHNLLRDLEAEMNDPAFQGATAAEKFAAIEGTLGDTNVIRDVPVIDKNSRGLAQALGEKFVQLGMDPEVAQLAIPYTVFDGLRAVQRNVISDPMKMVQDLHDTIANMDPVQANQWVKNYEQTVKAQMSNPAFLAAADTAWTGKKYTWVPGSEVRQRNGYMQAIEAARKADKEAGQTIYDINVPEFGELRRNMDPQHDYVYQLYNNMVDDLRSSPQGRERVAVLLRSNPIARFAANPTAPMHTKALVAYMNQPGTKRRELMNLLNEAGIESAQNMGHDPLVIAKHYDQYLSRAFTNAVDGGLKLNEFIKVLQDDPRMAAKLGKGYTSSRFARKLSDATSSERFTNMVNKGELSLYDALAATVTSSMALNSHLAAMNAMHDAYRATGNLSDTPKPGYVQISAKKAAPGELAASKGEYNLLYGKMGGKWVDPWVAHQMNLIPQGFRALNESLPAIQWLNNLNRGALGLMRYTHTQMNIPQYGLRNAIQDPLLVMAASGLNPYVGEGKKIMLACVADMDRYLKTREKPTGAIMSPEMREQIDAGVFNPDKLPAMSELTPAAREHVLQTAISNNKVTLEATNLSERLNLLARATMHSAALARLPVDVSMAMFQAGHDVKTGIAEARARGESPVVATVGSSSKLLEHLNEHLNRSALSLTIAQAEQIRAMWAYRVARQKLKLNPDRAAIFVRETMYGQERPSATMSAFMNNPTALVTTPLFLRFGIWQAQKYAQRALSDPHLWAAYAVAKGLDAMNEQRLLQETEGHDTWRGRLSEIHSKHTAVADVGLNTVGGVQEALKTIGMPEPAIKALGNPQDPITVGLSDVIGGQTFFHQIDPRKQGWNYVLQFGLLGPNVAQMATETRELEGYSDIGLPPGTEGAAPHLKEIAKGGLAKAMPSSAQINLYGWRMPMPLGRSLQALAGLAIATQKGEMRYRNVYGDKINPINELSKMAGPGMPNVIDSVAATRSIDRAMKMNATQFNMDVTKYQNKRIDPNLREELRASELKETDINSAVKQQQMKLSLAWQYGFLTRDDALRESKRIENLRKSAIEDVRKGGTGGNILYRMFDNDIINAASDSVTQALMDAGQEILDDEESKNPETQPEE